MQTKFTPEQLQDPAIQEADSILRKCVHCGFCTATCPTYVLLGDELDSPRGRIYLIKDMLENDKPASEKVVKHIDRCLSCLSCLSTCPSGVDYMHLVDQARARIEETYTRPPMDRLTRAMLAFVMPNTSRFRAAMTAARLGRPFAGIMPKQLRTMLELAPGKLPPMTKTNKPGTFKAAGPRRKRVALLLGCVQPALDPRINDATVRLLNRLGIEVVAPPEAGCCGALVHHMGREAEGQDYARNNVRAWMKEIEGDGLDAIVINASGCGTTVKDYGHMLSRDPAWAEKAAKVSGLTMDISEFLTSLDLPEPKIDVSGLTVAYHSACSLQHGQQVKLPPKQLLSGAGFKVKDVPEAHLCCGSAGTYNLTQPEIAGKLLARKCANIESVKPDVIAAGNIGCMTQIGQGTHIPIVHTVELLDWAHGGPKPAGMTGA
ncbi:glycolate oxidase subunit GlcF [Caenispirillum salinarum]|uniref:glycolate oxidase subunit GlcF n=1 Tax=Caenispirillum salinarum TaxID=859058 RepID=UPI00384D0879